MDKDLIYLNINMKGCFTMFDEKISVLIPFKSDGGYREKNWQWIKRRYETLLPNAEICIGSSDIEPFSRSAAINDAARRATREIFMIADADISFDTKQIELGIDALKDYVWVLPFVYSNFLKEDQTTWLLNQEPSITMSDIDFTGCHTCTGINSQIVIVPRQYFEKVGGFDERFKGWGCEDDAFLMAMYKHCGANTRLDGFSTWHLHHPHASMDNYGNNLSILQDFYLK